MWFARKKPKIHIAPSADGQDPRRSNLRHTPDAVICVLGEVLDISASGVRIRCAGKPPFMPGAVSSIKLGCQGGSLGVTVQERWRKRRGLRVYHIGLKFVNNSPNVMAAIDSLANFGFVDPEATAGGKSKTKSKGRVKIRVTVDLPDYYTALELTPDVGPEQIQAAYRQLARRYHPDVNKDAQAPQRFIDVCAAYKVLSDPSRRRSYDLRQAG